MGCDRRTGAQFLHWQLSRVEAEALGAEDPQRWRTVQQRLRAWVMESADAGVAAWHIIGNPMPESLLGPTPHAASSTLSPGAVQMQRFVARIATAFGECVTYPGMKQAHCKVQQVFPVAGFEDRQSAASSRTPLAWHTEHADKVTPPDLLVIGCLRNPDRIGTRLSHPMLHRLDQRTRDILAMASEFHFATRDETNRHCAILDPDRLRYDPVYCKPMSPRAHRAFAVLTRAVEAQAFTVPQAPGAVLIIPNRWTVHARESFLARFDGTDRWLMRAMVRLSIPPDGKGGIWPSPHALAHEPSLAL